MPQHSRRRVTVVVVRETRAIDTTLSKLTWILAAVASATTLLILSCSCLGHQSQPRTGCAIGGRH